MPKFCSKCGHQVLNPISDTFCANCGVSLRKYVVGSKDRDDEEPPKFKKCDCPCCKPEDHRQLRSQSLAPPPVSPKTPMSERNRTVSDLNISHVANTKAPQKDAKAGWLQKQSSDLLNSWKKRYFKLTWGILFYFSGPEDRKANGSIPLKNTNVEILRDNSKPNSFRLTTSTNKSFSIAAESSEEMHDWIEALLEFGAVMYDPKLHGYRAEIVDNNTGMSQTVPLDPLNGGRTLQRSNSSSAVAGKSGPFSFFKKKSKDSGKSVTKSSSTSRIDNISGPVLTTKPNPINISGFTPSGKQETTFGHDQDALREMLFSPAPRAKVVKKGNFNACDTCGYESEAFLRYCGSCGCKLLQNAGATPLS